MKSTSILIIFILLTIYFYIDNISIFGDSLKLCLINLNYKLLEGGFMFCDCSYFAVCWNHGKVFSNDF